MKREDKREKAIQPRLDHLWSRSPSPGGEGRPRGLKRSCKWVGVFRGFSSGFLSRFVMTMLVLDPSYRDDLSFGTSWYVMTLFFNLFFKRAIL